MKEILQQLTEAVRSLSCSRTYPDYAPDHVLDNDEVATILHCTVSAVDGYVCQKGLPYHKAGVKRLFFYGEVLNWLRANDCTNNADVKSMAKKESNAIDRLFGRTNRKKK